MSQRLQLDIYIFNGFPRGLLDPWAFENQLCDAVTDAETGCEGEGEGQVQRWSESSLQRIGSWIEIGAVLFATLETHVDVRFKVVRDERGQWHAINLNLVLFQAYSLPCFICACTHKGKREGDQYTVGPDARMSHLVLRRWTLDSWVDAWFYDVLPIPQSMSSFSPHCFHLQPVWCLFYCAALHITSSYPISLWTLIFPKHLIRMF